MQDDKKSIKQKIKNFPDASGVYLMKNKFKKIIYIGKATSLKKRVGSYFFNSLDRKTAQLVDRVEKIDYKETQTVVEALILEANLIKKYKPRYNIKLKDDKSFVNIIITDDEEYPRVLIFRPTSKKKIKTKYIFGPYTSKQEAEKVINLLVKIFSHSFAMSSTASLYWRYYIKGFSSEKVDDMSHKDYLKIINNIKLFLEGKKGDVLKKLEREMKKEAKNMHFEKASKLRDQIFALSHIQDFTFIKENDIVYRKDKKYPVRTEAYDISNISGKFSVGSMVVFSSGKANKAEYRKFKIKTVKGVNDIAMIQEVLERRFVHQEWKVPDLIIIDGGLGQKNIASLVLKKYNLDIPIIAIAKGVNRKGEKLFFSASGEFIFPDIEFVKKMRDEAHRFAIDYHKKLRKIV